MQVLHCLGHKPNLPPNRTPLRDCSVDAVTKLLVAVVFCNLANVKALHAMLIKDDAIRTLIPLTLESKADTRRCNSPQLFPLPVPPPFLPSFLPSFLPPLPSPLSSPSLPGPPP